MAKLSREEIIAKFKVYAGNRVDDETIELLEDISDSVNDNEIPTEQLIENAINEVEERWRRKYIERFINGESENVIKEKEKEAIIENLFE